MKETSISKKKIKFHCKHFSIFLCFHTLFSIYKVNFFFCLCSHKMKRAKTSSSGNSLISKNLESTDQKRSRVFLSKPLNSEETCSITLEHISINPSIHDFQIPYVPVAACPDHSCIELSCKHRFNGMALLMHFCSNSMTCPMCRDGLADSVLNYSLSFPEEPWIDIMQNFLMGKSDSPNPTLFANTQRLFPNFGQILWRGADSPVLQSESHPNLDPNIIPEYNESFLIESNFSLVINFRMYRNHYDQNNNDNTAALNNNANSDVFNAIFNMTCSLDPNSTRDCYTISANSTRLLSNAIQDLQIRSISAVIYARNHTHNSTVQIATMRRTELNPQTTEIVAEISPPIYSIRISLQPPANQPQPQGNNATFLRYHSSPHFPSQVQSDILSLLGIMFMPSDTMPLQPASLQNTRNQDYEFNMVTYSSL